MRLPSLDFLKRRKEQKELRENEKYEMGMKLVSKPDNNYQRSLDSSNDHYMRKALQQVKRSNVSIPQDLARMHGTTLYNPSIRQKEIVKENSSDLTKTLDQLEKEVRDELLQKTPKKRDIYKPKKQSTEPKSETQKILHSSLSDMSIRELEECIEHGFRHDSSNLLFGVKERYHPSKKSFWGKTREQLF